MRVAGIVKLPPLACPRCRHMSPDVWSGSCPCASNAALRGLERTFCDACGCGVDRRCLECGVSDPLAHGQHTFEPCACICHCGCEWEDPGVAALIAEGEALELDRQRAQAEYEHEQARAAEYEYAHGGYVPEEGQ